MSLDYVVAHRTPGREGSHIARCKTYGRAVARARKFNESEKVAVGVWSDKSTSYLLEIAADGTESKPAESCPNAIRLLGASAVAAWNDRAKAPAVLKWCGALGHRFVSIAPSTHWTAVDGWCSCCNFSDLANWSDENVDPGSQVWEKIARGLWRRVPDALVPALNRSTA